MDEQTRKLLQAPFRPEQIKQRQGSFGKTLSYVEGSAVIERLNIAFDHAWSFEVLSIDINTDAGEVIAHVRIRAAGQIKDGYGSSQIKLQRQRGEIIDLGNDIKAACTDALKKTATLYGVGLHLYQNPDLVAGQEEQKQSQGQTLSRAEHQAGEIIGGRRSGSSNSKTTRTHLNQDSAQKGIGTVTEKQLNYLKRLAKKQAISEERLQDYCSRVYAANLETISKSEASFLIESLRHGKLPYYDNAA
jgi:hypothetical protein